MPVREITPGQRTITERDAHGGESTILGNLGIWLIIIPAGFVIWATNGWFSVAGLGTIAEQFNAGGATAYRIATLISVPIFSIAFPVFPWLMVLGTSLLQINTTRKFRHGKKIPGHWFLIGIALSLYDFTTSYFGIGATPWMQAAATAGAWGVALQFVCTALLTFSVEIIIGILLPGIPRIPRRR